MDVFDGDRNVLDSCSDSIGFKGIYTWFAVEEDWEWKDIRGRMTDVGVDVLKVSCFLVAAREPRISLCVEWRAIDRCCWTLLWTMTPLRRETTQWWDFRLRVSLA